MMLAGRIVVRELMRLAANRRRSRCTRAASPGPALAVLVDAVPPRNRASAPATRRRPASVDDRRIVPQRIVLRRQLHEVANILLARAARRLSTRTAAATAASLPSARRAAASSASGSEPRARSTRLPCRAARPPSSRDSAPVGSRRYCRILSRAWASDTASLKIVRRLVGPHQPAADRERHFLLGRQVRRHPPAARTTPAGRSRLRSTSAAISLAKPSANLRPLSSAIFATCAFSSSSRVLRRCILGSVLVQQLAHLLQRFAGNAFGRKLREQIPRQADAARLRPAVEFPSGSAAHRAAAVAATSSLQIFTSGKSLMTCSSSCARVAVALALQIQPHDLQPAFEVVRLHRRWRARGSSVSRGMLLVAIRMSHTIGFGPPLRPSTFVYSGVICVMPCTTESTPSRALHFINPPAIFVERRNAQRPGRCARCRRPARPPAARC